jgi:hypothetical protein
MEASMVRSDTLVFSALMTILFLPSAIVLAQEEKEAVPIEKIDLGDLKDHFRIVNAYRGAQDRPKEFSGDPLGGASVGLFVKLKCVKAIELSDYRLRAGYFSKADELMETVLLAPPDFRMEPGEFVGVEIYEPSSAEGWKRCVVRSTKSSK